MSGIQMLVVVVLLLMFLSISVGVAGAFRLRQRWPRLRWPLVTLLALALAIIAASMVAASAYPGPSGRYLPGSVGWAIRERFVYPSGILVFATPILIALAASYVVPGGSRRAAVVAGAAGILTIPVALSVLVFNGCSYTGVCF